MEIEEINDSPSGYAIENVAYGSSNDESDGNRTIAMLPDPRQKKYHNNRRNQRKNHRRGSLAENAERYAAIFDHHDIKKRQYAMTFSKAHRLHNDKFRRLIAQQHEKNDDRAR
jgi:hypothetical protein